MRVKRIAVPGGTGYLGEALIPQLLARGHRVRALARPGSEGKLPAGCDAVLGNALDGTSFAREVAPADTLVHLVGVPHPAPWKADQFRKIDLVSVHASVAAAREAGIRHFVYLSIAQPAPIMKSYVAGDEDVSWLWAAHRPYSTRQEDSPDGPCASPGPSPPAPLPSALPSPGRGAGGEGPRRRPPAEFPNNL